MSFERVGPGTVWVRQALADLDAALDLLTAGLWWQLPEAELAEAAVALHRMESRVAAAQVGVLAEVIDRGLPTGSGSRGAAAWLRGLVPVTPSQAAARAALAEALPPVVRAASDGDPGHDLAPTRAALDSGAISAAQAAVLARTSAAIDSIPGDDARPGGVDPVTKAEALGVLLEFADRLDVAQLGKAAARARYLLDRGAAQRLAKDEDAQREAQGGYLVQDPMTGMWHGELDRPRSKGPTSTRWSTFWPNPARPRTAPPTSGRPAAGGPRLS